MDDAIQTLVVDFIRILGIEPSKEPFLRSCGNLWFRQTADGDANPVSRKRAYPDDAIAVLESDCFKVQAGR